MKIKDYFSNEFETQDFHTNDLLKTHYYKADLRKATLEFKEVMHALGFELLEELEEYHEMHYYKNQIEVIASIYSESYFKQGIDFKVNTSFIFPRGRGLKMIEKIYASLNQRLERIQ